MAALSWSARFLLSVLCCSLVASAANIIMVMTTPLLSHHMWSMEIAYALADRDHKMTTFSPFPLSKNNPNIEHFVLEGVSHKSRDFLGELKEPVTAIDGITIMFSNFVEQCEASLDSPGMVRFFDTRGNSSFDLLLVEAIGSECFLSLAGKFHVPVVAFSPGNLQMWVLEMAKTPNSPFYIPHYMMAVNMEKFNPVQAIVLNMFTYVRYQFRYLYLMDDLADKYFEQDVMLPSEIIPHVSLTLANFHPAVDYNMPRSNVLISVPGLQIKENELLPSDLQEFLDNATEGAILFSLGSNLESINMDEQMRQHFVDAFSQLPQKIVWKWENDAFPEKPTNVKIMKWVPQNGVLAHPNVQLFINHGGLLSTHEAIYHAVPILAIPFFVDHHLNILKLIKYGAGLKLNYQSLSNSTLLGYIHEMTKSSSYKKNMLVLSSYFKDNQQKPIDTAVFWIEYTIKHQGTGQLRPEEYFQWYWYFLFDLIVTTLILLFLIHASVYIILTLRNME